MSIALVKKYNIAILLLSVTTQGSVTFPSEIEIRLVLLSGDVEVNVSALQGSFTADD